MLTLHDLTLFYPEQTSLELSSVEIDTVWQQVSCQAYSNQNARLRAFHNLLCGNALSPFLCTSWELSKLPHLWLSSDELPSIWEMLNGHILISQSIRLAIIPSDAVRLEELRVEREWVDIPELAAHYYVAVQVDVEKRWLRILGYASHAQLKQTGNYDSTDQTYALDQEDLIDDLGLLSVQSQFGWHQSPVVEPIAPLSATAMSSIIHQINAHRQFSSRRILPFEQWAPIVANAEWRRWLYHQKIENSEATTWASTEPSPKVDLSNWAHHRFPPEWRPVAEVLQSTPAPATAKGIATMRAKAITLGCYQVALIVSRELETIAQPTVGLQLEAQMMAGKLPLTAPLNLQIAFCDANGNENTITENWLATAIASSIQLPRLLGNPGEEFTVTLSLDNDSVMEIFIL
jgi:Protein of unknown function (DUF1822)